MKKFVKGLIKEGEKFQRGIFYNRYKLKELESKIDITKEYLEIIIKKQNNDYILREKETSEMVNEIDNLRSDIDTLLECLRKDSKKIGEQLDKLIQVGERNIINISEFNKEVIGKVKNLGGMQDKQVELTEKILQVNEKDIRDLLNKVKELEIENKEKIGTIELVQSVLMPRSVVHISAYIKYGNAGDNILIPALRDSVENTINCSLYWCNKTVREKVDDETISIINASNALIIGGGGLFLKDTNRNDISGWQWSCSLNCLDKIRVPMYMFGVGYNRFRGQDDFEPYFKKNINEVVRKCEFVGLRNSGSVRAIQQYLDEELKEKVKFHPCATTVLSKMYRMPTVHVDKPFIAVNCAFDRSNMRYGERKEQILYSIANVLKKYSEQYDIKYYAHMQSDKEILPYLDKMELKYEVVNLDNGLSIDDFLKIYSEPALVLAMRGHAQLIPFGCLTPVLSIISHDKLQWFLEDINHTEWGVDVREENFETKLFKTMQYMLSNLETIKNDIKDEQEKLWIITQNNIKKCFKMKC